MLVPVLAQILVTERFRYKTTKKGFAIPLISSQELSITDEPLLVSNTSGCLLKGKVSRIKGVANYAYYPCKLENEKFAITKLYQEISKIHLVSTYLEATQLLNGDPKVMIAGKDSPLESIAYVPVITVDSLEPSQAILFTDSKEVGYYTRIRDHLGLLFTKVDRSMVAIELES